MKSSFYFWNGEISLQVESTILSKALKEILVKNFSIATAFFFVYSTLILGSFAKQESYASETHYELNKDRQRTSRIIKKGHLRAFMERREATQVVKLEYELEVVFYGKKRGSSEKKLPAEFFTEAFLIKLREAGEMTYEDTLIRHLGMADIQNKDGLRYLNCHKIHLIDQRRAEEEDSRTQQENPDDGIFSHRAKNLEATLWMHQRVPGIKAARVDVKGKQNGMNIHIGFDYAPR